MEWAQRRTWRVIILFADALMMLLSQLPPAERDYRDAANLLRLIAASAIWHFQHRQHAITDESVTVVADLADYAFVRRLVAPAFAKTRAFALSEGERQIIDALRTSDTPMTVKEIAQALNLSPTAVRCRLNRLKAKEIVVDEQSLERREKVWRVIASATLMNDLLPTPEQVATMWRPEPDQPTPQNSQKNLPQDDEGSSVHAFMSVHDPRTLENAKQDWDFCACVHAFTEHYLSATHQDEANPTANPDVIENGERTNASPKTLSSISENER
jgi:DNA-binding CsgD family transcriptional regulator